MASTDARPIPIKNTAYRVTFPIMDNTGALVTGAASLSTSQVSKDAGTFATVTNTPVEIATASGMYYLDLTSTEMNADCVAIIIKTTTTNAKSTPIVLYPQESGDIKVDLQSVGGTAQTAGDIIASIPSANSNADALLDRAAGVETGWTMRQAFRIMLSAMGGKASGLAGTTAVYRDMADSKNRISATVDANGNRTAVTLDAT